MKFSQWYQILTLDLTMASDLGEWLRRGHRKNIRLQRERNFQQVDSGMDTNIIHAQTISYHSLRAPIHSAVCKSQWVVVPCINDEFVTIHGCNESVRPNLKRDPNRRARTIELAPPLACHHHFLIPHHFSHPKKIPFYILCNYHSPNFKKRYKVLHRGNKIGTSFWNQQSTQG